MDAEKRLIEKTEEILKRGLGSARFQRAGVVSSLI